MEDNQKLIADLVEIRKSSRKMQSNYLAKHNLLDKINTIIPEEHWKIKEKIDKIIQNDYKQCYCGKLTKPSSQWCSSYCKDQSLEVKNKISEKNTKNAKERMIKTKKTVMERYGVSHVQQVASIKEKTMKSNAVHHEQWIKDTFTRYGLNYDEFNNPEIIESLCKTTSVTRLSLLHFNGMPVNTLFRFIYRVCPDIEIEHHISGGEKELANYIKSLGFDIIKNDRVQIKPYEIDVYVPAKKIGFEFNGLYYHKGNKNKHKEKMNMCLDNNISLIQIFEDEWAFKNNIIKSMIKSKLGLNNKISARATTFKEVSNKEAKQFLEDNHIQGFINGQHYGLYLKNQLVSIITIGKCRYYDGQEILRYCSLVNYNVIGGFSKLLKNVKLVAGVSEIYTFADLRFSNGSTYEKYGKLIKVTEPGYFWYHTKTIQRTSRYQSQKHKLPKLLGDKFDLSKSENQNMIDAGYEKIYDCGHKLYLV